MYVCNAMYMEWRRSIHLLDSIFESKSGHPSEQLVPQILVLLPSAVLMIYYSCIILGEC